MKAFQRILAVVLAMVMSLSLIGVAAFAAENTDDTITGTSGSITIHKYEFNDDNSADTYKGTGSASDTVPGGATALNGAGFTIYKVADVNALTNYYSTNPTDLPNVSTYLSEDGKSIGADYADTKVGSEVKTNENGLAEFKDLELGLYVVIETTTPDSVTDPCDPFIVSVPMTKVTGDGWLYDIHVYPKNGTSYGEVQLKKLGEDGALLSGVTFALQKKNGESWTTITKQSNAQGDNQGDALNLTTVNGIIKVSGLSQGTYRFIETSVGDNSGYIMDGASTYEFTINADGTVTYGETTDESVTIEVKNEKPDVDKVVGDEKKEADDYSVGDDVPYEITVDVPANIDKLTTFTLTDTLTNQTVSSDITVTGVGSSAYTVTVAEDKKSFEIEFTPSALKGVESLTITYTAKLLSTAATTTDGNPNSVSLTYDNEIIPTDTSNPNTPEEPKDPDTTTITDQTVVYTFELKVDKDDESGNALAGVMFDVYSYSGTESHPTEADLKANGTKVASIETGAQGLATVKGLENGTYYLVETETVDGYNLLKAPVAVTLDIEYKKTWTENTEWDSNGNLIKHDVNEKEEYFGGSSENSVGANFASQTIVNKKGFNLPQTGGIGTLMFIIIGGVLMAGGICLIVPNKKRAV